MAERIITASPTNSDFDNEATLQPGVARVIFAEPEEDDCDDLDVGFSHSLPHPPPQEPTPPVPTSSMVTFKIEHIGITKKVALPSLSSWTLAKEKICEAMRLNPDSVSFCKYADEDGDFITIDSDADLRAFAAMPSLPTLTVVTFSEQQEEQKHRQKPSPQALVVIDMLADLVQSNPDALSSAMLSQRAGVSMDTLVTTFHEKLADKRAHPPPVPPAITTAQLQAQARSRLSPLPMSPSIASLTLNPSAASSKPKLDYPIPPNSDWASDTSSIHTPSIAGSVTPSSSSHASSHPIAVALHAAIDHAATAHEKAQTHAAKTVARVISNARAIKNDACAAIDSRLDAAPEPVQAVRKEAHEALRWLGQTATSAVKMATGRNEGPGSA